MTSERRVMELFEQANPIPDPDTYIVVPDPDRVMQTDRDPTIIDPTSEHPASPGHRWLLPAIAAAVVVIVIAGLIVFAVDDDAPTPADTPTPITTAPPSTTTLNASDELDPTDVVEGFFDAYRAGDTDAILAMLTEDVVVSEVYDGAEPAPNDPPIPTAQQHLAWKLARGETVGEPTCVAATPQPGGATTMRCEYATDGLVQGAGSTPIPTRTLFFIDDGMISEIHQGYGDPAQPSHDPRSAVGSSATTPTCGTPCSDPPTPPRTKPSKANSERNGTNSSPRSAAARPSITACAGPRETIQ